MTFALHETAERTYRLFHQNFRHIPEFNDTKLILIEFPINICEILHLDSNNY